MIFQTMALVASMTGLQSYDLHDLDRVIETSILASDALQHDCFPSYVEATQELGIVKIPHYCGLEITTNTHTNKTTMKETTFDLIIEPKSMSWMRSNFITQTK